MNQYKDTTKQTKPQQRAGMGQNDNKTKVTFADIIQTIINALLVTGVLWIITHCEPVQAKLQKNNLPLVAGMGQNIDLSKTISGQASRYLLAFFVSKFWLAPQATQSQAQHTLTHFTGLNRHILGMPAFGHTPAYGGVTLQNKRKPICRAVTNSTESEPRHPMTFHSVVLTQKLLGGYHA